MQGERRFFASGTRTYRVGAVEIGPWKYAAAGAMLISTGRNPRVCSMMTSNPDPYQERGQPGGTLSASSCDEGRAAVELFARAQHPHIVSSE